MQRQIEELLALQASEWLETLGTANAAERKAFAEWLGESRLHVQAFLEVAEIEFQLARIDPQRRRDIDALLSRVASNVVHAWRPASRCKTSWRRRLRVPGILAACASLVALAVLFLSAHEARYETAIGEQKTVELADASVITLNSASRIEVRLADRERTIELSEGEAIFTVAHDPTRPFKVHTRAGTVLAVGTQFNVHERANGDTRVSVLEGRVRLLPRTANADTVDGDDAQVLMAGQEADLRLDGTIHRIANAVVTNTVAWRQRRLNFDNTGLAEMVAEFNRYNPTVHLRLEGVPQGMYRYSGVFDVADPESFISFLKQEPDLEIVRRGTAVIVRPRAPREY